MKVNYTCPHCGEEIVVMVRINEEDDLPEDCPECGKKLPEDASAWCNERAIEIASEPWDDER